MKKNILNIAMLAIVALLTMACTATVDEIFDVPASERLNQTQQKDQEVLMGAKNGWRMEFYGNRSYGGYNIFLNFNDKQNVTIASEKFPASNSTHKGGLNEETGKLNTCTSHYKLEQSMGIVLSFDDYNEIFHYFSEPKNPDGIGDSGEGLKGDLEFRILSACADSVIMEGKKHQNRIKMYPMPEDKSWEDVYQEICNTEQFMKSRSYYVYKDGVDTGTTAVTSYRCLYFYFNDSTDTKTSVGAPFIVTPDGYKFYKSVDVNGLTIDGFFKGDSNLAYISRNDEKISLVSYIPSLYEQISGDTWFIAYSNLPKKSQTWWDALKKKLKTAGANRKEAICYYAYVGANGGKTMLFLNVDGEPVQVGLRMTQTDTDGNQVKITYDAKNNNKKGDSYINKYALDQVLMTFIGEDFEGRTFDLTTDNKRTPTYLELTDVKDPSFVIKLLYNTVYYPYDN